MKTATIVVTQRELDIQDKTRWHEIEILMRKERRIRKLRSILNIKNNGSH